MGLLIMAAHCNALQTNSLLSVRLLMEELLETEEQYVRDLEHLCTVSIHTHTHTHTHTHRQTDRQMEKSNAELGFEAQLPDGPWDPFLAPVGRRERVSNSFCLHADRQTNNQKDKQTVHYLSHLTALHVING